MERMLDVLCPMHLVVSLDGVIEHAGPTLEKLVPEGVQGRAFLDLFEVRRPRDMQSVRDLKTGPGATVLVRLRDDAKTAMKGVVVAAPGDERIVINLSFGISIVESVGQYKLTAADFAATDLTIEMLYLVEAKSAAMDASRKLNQRLQGAMIAAEEQAFTDTLTGLKNRRALDHVLSRIMEYQTPFSLMQLDLDYFKKVNDTLGHAAGDHVLLKVARILVEETRGEDTVARVGGDEFVLIFHNTWDLSRLGDIAGRLIQRLEEPIPFGDQTCQISGSIGITMSEQYDDFDLSRIFEDVDLALYASKHGGRGQYTFYTDELRHGGVLKGLRSAG